MKYLFIFDFLLNSIIYGFNSYYVSNNGDNINGEGSAESPFQTIQFAINTSSSGDSIFIANGQYDENLIISKAINIKGESYYGTIIDAYPTGRALNVVNINEIDTLTVEYLTLKNGSQNNGSGALVSDSNVKFNFTRVVDNYASGGGAGIRSQNSYIEIKNSFINNNNSNLFGAGISVENFSTVHILNTEIKNNSSANFGGGVHLDSASTVTMDSVLIQGNTAYDNAAAINCYKGLLTINNSSILNNITTNGATAGIAANGLITIKNTIIAGNQSNGGDGGGEGAAISLWGNFGELQAEFDSLTIYNNYSAGSGSAVRIQDASNVTLKNSLIYNNTSYYGGGAIFGWNSGIDIDNCTIVNNTALDDNGNTSWSGGGVSFHGWDTTLTYATINNSIIFDNTPNDIYKFVTQPKYEINFSNINESDYLLHSNPGEGYIDDNPLFCYPDYGDFSLASTSPSLATGYMGSNMGSLDQGCIEPLNFPANDFTINAPSDSYLVVVGTNQAILFSWDETTDPEGDEISYKINLEFPNNSSYSINAAGLSHVLLVTDIQNYILNQTEDIFELNWNVFALSGSDSTISSNGPKVILIDKSEALGVDFVATPVNFSLEQNYPNPFNPVTSIGFTSPNNSFANLTVFDLKGSKVKTLIKHKIKVGYNSVVWDGTNYNGQKVSAGIYFYTLRTNNNSKTKKMFLIK